MLPLNPLYTSGELRDPLNAAGVGIVVTLTPFYSRLKDMQSETRVKRVIATSIKEYLPPLLRVLFTLFKEKKGGPVSSSSQATMVSGLSQRHSYVPSLRSRRPSARRSSNHVDERRNDRRAEGRRRTASLPRSGRHAAVDLASAAEECAAGYCAGASPFVSRVHVRRRAEPLNRQPHSDGARPQPSRYRRPAEDDRDRPPDAFHRRARAVHCAAQSSQGEEQVSRLQLDPGVILRCGSIDGGNKNAVRGAHGRPHRRRLLADRSDDGLRREPAERRQRMPIVGVPLPDVEVAIVDTESGPDSCRPAKRAKSFCAHLS